MAAMNLVSDVVQLQVAFRHLKTNGSPYWSGPIDGKMTKDLISNIRLFQKNNGIAVTGHIAAKGSDKTITKIRNLSQGTPYADMRGILGRPIIFSLVDADKNKSQGKIKIEGIDQNLLDVAVKAINNTCKMYQLPILIDNASLKSATSAQGSKLSIILKCPDVSWYTNASGKFVGKMPTEAQELLSQYIAGETQGRITATWNGAASASSQQVTKLKTPHKTQKHVVIKLTHWPVPSSKVLNTKDKLGEGDGSYGSPRNGGRKHNGIDILAHLGANIVATGDGIIAPIHPNPSKSYGKQIVIDHGTGIFSQYAHLQSIGIKVGAIVKGGDVIGTVGRSGNTPKAGDTHLHFEIRKGSMWPASAGGNIVDPMLYLP